MPRKAIIDKQTGLIINVIEADDSFKSVLPDDVEMIDAPYKSGYEIGHVVDLNQPEFITVDIQTEEKVPLNIPAEVLEQVQQRVSGRPNSIPAKQIPQLPPNVKVIHSYKVATNYQSMTATDDENERQRVINEWNQKVQLAINKFNEMRFKVPNQINEETINEVVEEVMNETVNEISNEMTNETSDENTEQTK
jgi:hypothetical protein